MRPYPVPSAHWVQENHIISEHDRKLVVDILDILSDDVRFMQIFYNVDDYDMNSVPQDAIDIAFAVLLTFLDICWEEVSEPLVALETLVTDFRNARTIWCGTGDLPQRIAGLGSLDNSDELCRADARSLIRACVTSLVAEGRISRPHTS